MIQKEIQEKFKAYKKEVCEELGVDENSIRLCDLAKQEPLDENGEIKDDIKDKIRRRIESFKNNKKELVQGNNKVGQSSDEVGQKRDKIDHSKIPLKKMTITSKFIVEIPENVSIKKVEELYSKLAKEHFENCKEIICH